MPVALCRRGLGRVVRRRARAQWHDYRRIGVACGDLSVDVVPVVRAVGVGGGHRTIDLVEQGADLRAIVAAVVGQRRRDEPWPAWSPTRSRSRRSTRRASGTPAHGVPRRARSIVVEWYWSPFLS